MAASVGISESVANSLLSSRDQTALKDFKSFSRLNPFFRPLVAFCSALMADEMHKFQTLEPLLTKLVKDLA